jgi:DNA polymerase-1
MLREDMTLHFVDNMAELRSFYDWLNKGPHPVMGIDTETTGLKIYQTEDLTSIGGEVPFHCRMIQVGDETAGWAFPTDPMLNWSGPVLEFMNAYDGIWVAHNIAYDAQVLKQHFNFDFPWERTHDTMIMAQMLRPQQSAALKKITQELIDPRAADMQSRLDYDMKQGDWGWADIPYEIPSYGLYSALDPVLAVELWHKLRADQLFPESFDLEMSALRIAIGMAHRGVRVDLEYSERKYYEIMEYVERSRKWAKDNLQINIGSTVQLSRWFLNNGAELTAKTNSGSYKMDKDVLRSIALNGNSTVKPIAEFVQNVKNQEKMANTYLLNFANFSTKGVLHPNIKTMGAQTSGRMSITDPAMQTLPKGDKLIRRAIIPNENEVFISADEDQMEFRIFAVLSGDQALIDLFNHADATGGDPFTNIGKQIYQDDSFVKSDPRRRLVKSSVYGRLFGAGVAKQADTAGVDKEVMQKISDDMEAMYPGFISLPLSIQREVTNTVDPKTGYGYVDTIFTHRRIPVPGDKVYRGTNYRIQGSGSEMLKLNMVKMANAGLEQYMKLPIHDEVLLSVPPEDVKDVMPVLEECMTTRGYSVTFKAGSEYKGTSWAGNIDELQL